MYRIEIAEMRQEVWHQGMTWHDTMWHGMTWHDNGMNEWRPAKPSTRANQNCHKKQSVRRYNKQNKQYYPNAKKPTSKSNDRLHDRCQPWTGKSQTQQLNDSQEWKLKRKCPKDEHQSREKIKEVKMSRNVRKSKRKSMRKSDIPSMERKKV